MLLLLTLPAQAQDSAATHSAADRVLAAAQLPRLATSLRESGVPAAEVRGALEALSGADVPAVATVMILEDEREAAERGATGGFRSTVESRLGEGLRDEALVAAIRVERAAPARSDADAEPGRVQ